MALNRSDKSRILRRYFPGMTRNSEMSTEPRHPSQPSYPTAEAPDSWSGAFLWLWRLHRQVCSGALALLLDRDGAAGRSSASLEWDANEDVGEFIHFVGG